MLAAQVKEVAIVDYGLGNLFSIKHACEYVGLQGAITSSRAAILRADAVILPGVGAFGDAMETLNRLGLVSVLQEITESAIPLVGICLGMQLLMTESHEFGHNQGLGIIKGPVSQLKNPMEGRKRLKVPHVGWNSIHCADRGLGREDSLWDGTMLDGLADGEAMYFVHSYVVEPEDPGVILSTSGYGQIEFCSSLQYRNIFACQFHPERSGPQGLKVYQNLASVIQRQVAAKEENRV